MLHRITGRATKCGPSAISAIAGVPTHEAAAVIRRLYDRRAVNGVYMDDHFVAYGDGHVADSGAWFRRKPVPWSRANPDHDRTALRRVREAVRFVRASRRAEG